MIMLTIFGIITLLSWLIAFLIAFGEYLFFYKPSSYWLNKLLSPFFRNENIIFRFTCIFVTVGALSTVFIYGILIMKLMK